MTDVVRLPGPSQTAVLAVAVTAVSTSGPIIAACAAPALAIAFWRCLLGSAATAPYALRRGARHWRHVPAAQLRSVLVVGLALAAHFGAWVPSLSFTSVASATALVATQPVWAALLARRAGARISRAVWVGIAVSLAGVLVVTGVDWSLDPRSLIGDGLALLGAVLAAVYVTLGERSRQALDTADFTLVVYATAAAALVVPVLVFGVPLTGFSARDWWLILALTACAQLLGHSLIAHSLRATSATVVSLAILFEVPGAILLAALWLHQLPHWPVLPGLLLLTLGLAIVVRSARTPDLLESPPV